MAMVTVERRRTSLLMFENEAGTKGLGHLSKAQFRIGSKSAICALLLGEQLPGLQIMKLNPQLFST